MIQEGGIPSPASCIRMIHLYFQPKKIPLPGGICPCHNAPIYAPRGHDPFSYP